MGVLNITPDSFSDGGKYFYRNVILNKVIEDAVNMEKNGADFIDVGGESTRPGSQSITISEEIERVIPVISELKNKIRLPISIDTYKSEVAEEALKAGASIVNDISGFKFDDKIAGVTAKHNASCILMHIKGTPKNMQVNPVYKNVVEEVFVYLKESIDIAKSKGIMQIIIDVGIGFGKTLEHNLELIRNLRMFTKLNCPILFGVSRKSFIHKIYPSPVNERLEGTIAANTIGIMNGANILRVHDVLENIKAARVADKILYN
ncbi:MAG: dihydropteroate synthase [Bacteroidota bacterium]|nr:dihydropteroate synthase [Bacteroidota bacterium]